jgi:hypothetical protein
MVKNMHNCWHIMLMVPYSHNIMFLNGTVFLFVKAYGAHSELKYPRCLPDPRSLVTPAVEC